MRKSVVIWSTLGTAATTVTTAVLLGGSSGEESKKVGSASLSPEKEPEDDPKIEKDEPVVEPTPPDQKGESDPHPEPKTKEPEQKTQELFTEQKPDQVQEQIPPKVPEPKAESVPKAPTPNPPKPPQVQPPAPRAPVVPPAASTPRPKVSNTKPAAPTIGKVAHKPYHVPNHALHAVFNIGTVNSDAGNEGDPPALKISKGACGDAFFPGVEMKMPEQYVKDVHNRNMNVLRGFSLDGPTQPIGCKVIRFSEIKNKAGFGYLSETVVKNGNTGFAMYVAATNAQTRHQTVFDVWFMLLAKDGETWSITKSYRMHHTQSMKPPGSSSLLPDSLSFYAETPDKKELRWTSADPNYSQNTLEKFLAKSSDYTWLWEHGKDQYYVGVWVGGQKGEQQDTKPLFYEGSNERWALSFWLGSSDYPPKIHFLQTVKLTQEGKWVSVKQQCASLASKRYFEMNNGELVQCIWSSTSDSVS